MAEGDDEFAPALDELAVETQIGENGEHRCQYVAAQGCGCFAAQREGLPLEAIEGPEYEGYKHTKGLSAPYGAIADNGIPVSKGRVLAPPAEHT